ncbi:SHOCT domain-containing protein [Methylomarinum vadi]|uniref:SHOCT domain-containing protein n=1 Tax=Methylomarinum vadi TaxID=438855 RepID=UPI0004DF6947|nr:SHOCT domain-containing protein [Methylomarinum vadi]
MQQLTSKGQQIVNDLSQRYGFSPDAVTHMLIAVLNGNGTMAQFNHPEFAGSGQWMQGGMLMLGDMFNYSLKNRIDTLCSEISGILANQPGLLRSGSFQSQSQSGGGQQSQVAGAPMGESSLFVPDPKSHWWPKDLGIPSATGSQNHVRYAYFANSHRLAVETNEQVWLYDTLDHQIGGFSQQQGAGGSILFTSQYGTVNLADLPVLSIDGKPTKQPRSATAAKSINTPSEASSATASEEDIFSSLERLGDLHAKGILTDEEFAQKKGELLQRL